MRIANYDLAENSFPKDDLENFTCKKTQIF